MKRERAILVIAAAFLVIWIIYSVAPTLLYSGHPMPYGMRGYRTAHPGVIAPRLFGPLFWVFLLIFVLYLLQSNGEKREEREEAIEILKRRYAKGEIGRDEYLQVFKDVMEK